MRFETEKRVLLDADDVDFEGVRQEVERLDAREHSVFVSSPGRHPRLLAQVFEFSLERLQLGPLVTPPNFLLHTKGSRCADAIGGGKGEGKAIRTSLVSRRGMAPMPKFFESTHTSHT